MTQVAKIQTRSDGSLVAVVDPSYAVSREEVQRIHAEAVAERDHSREIARLVGPYARHYGTSLVGARKALEDPEEVERFRKIQEELVSIGTPKPAPKPVPKSSRRPHQKRTPEEKIQEAKAMVEKKPRTRVAQAAAAKRAAEKAAAEKAAAEKAPKAEKVVTVREDPIDNLFLIRMRAKWAAQREDRRTARLEAALESDPTNTALAHEVEVAQEKSRKAWAAEGDAMVRFQKARAAAKAKAKAEGKRLVGPVEVSSLPKTAKARSKTAAPVAEPVAEVVVA